MLNIVGLTIVLAVKSYAFSSVWCFYAAILSVVLYWHFRDGHVAVGGSTDSAGAARSRPR